MEFSCERFKDIVDKIHGLREDVEEIEAALCAITEGDAQDPQDWLEVYLRDRTTACNMLANKRKFTLQEIAKEAKELTSLIEQETS